MALRWLSQKPPHCARVDNQQECGSLEDGIVWRHPIQPSLQGTADRMSPMPSPGNQEVGERVRCESADGAGVGAEAGSGGVDGGGE